MASVQNMAVQSGWLTEKTMKHMVKKYSGKEFTLDDLKKDKVLSCFFKPSTVPVPEKKKAAKKGSVEKKPKKADGFSPLSYLKENPEAKIEFSGTKGGKNAEKFEKYKKATTFEEFIELGGSNCDINYDFKRGLLKIDCDGTEKKVEKTTKPKSPKTDKPKSTKKSKKVEKVSVEKEQANETPPENDQSVEKPDISDELDEDDSPSSPIDTEEVDTKTEDQPDPNDVETDVEADDGGKDSESDDSDDDDDSGITSISGFNITPDESDDSDNED